MIIVYVDVFLSLNGAVIPDHGYVAIIHIGSTNDNTALLCNTNRTGTPTSGDWFGPDETRVDDTSVPGVTRNRGPMVVRLKRPTTNTPLEGIYCCLIPVTASTLLTVNVDCTTLEEVIVGF